MDKFEEYVTRIADTCHKEMCKTQQPVWLYYRHDGIHWADVLVVVGSGKAPQGYLPVFPRRLPMSASRSVLRSKIHKAMFSLPCLPLRDRSPLPVVEVVSW